MEIQQIAVMSTAHLTQQAAETLQEWAKHEADHPEGCAGRRDVWDRIEGIMVYIGIDDAATLDEEMSLCACVDHLTMRGPHNANFILFDRDADHVPGLPTYDW